MEATSFWLVLGAIAIAAVSTENGLVIMISGFAMAAVYLALAYFCWNEKRWAFLAAFLFAIVNIAGTVVFSTTEVSVTALQAVVGVLILVPQLLLLFHSLRAFRELAAG
ncbi:MAG: hypothetical protein ACE5JL_11580 [Dehalococcoidia bacterium]